MSPLRSLHRFALLSCLALLCAASAAQAQQGVTSPGPVTNLALDPGNQSLTVTWGPPASDGGSPVISYTVSCAPAAGGQGWRDHVVNDGNARSYTITACGAYENVYNGTTYAVRVKANNYWANGDDTEVTIVSMNAGAPDAPTITAAAKANSPGEVTLSWPEPDTNGSAITKYEYQVNTGNWTTATVSGATSKSTDVTGLTNGQEYTFRLRATNGHGTGPAGEDTATPLGPPVKPRNLSATDNNQASGAVRLTWDALSSSTDTGGSALTGWKYQQDTGDWTDIQGSGASTTSHTVTGLTNGTEYTFKVRAVNAQGEGAESDAAKATPSTTPAKPTLSATDNQQASGTVKLSWTAGGTGGSAITGWKYQQDTGDWTDIQGSGASTTSYTVTGLTNGTDYTFQVRAVNKKGDGTASAAVTATPSTTPGAPTGLSATSSNQTARQVALSWTAPTSNGGATITGYEYSKDNGSNWASAGTTTNYTVKTGLANGTAYTFKVRAVNKKGGGTASDDATATTTTTPAAPTNLTAADGDQQVALSWTAPTDNGGLAITGYDYSTDNGSNWTPTGSTTTSHTVTNLTNGTEYTFKVRAVNAAGSTASAAVTATPAKKPAAPTLTTPVIVGNKQVRLRWTAGNDGGAAITGYDYQQDGGSWTPIPNSGASTTSTLVTDLTNGTEYTFKVRAKNRKGNGAESDEETATPRNFTATAGNQSVTLNWNALPANTNIATWQYRQNGTWTAIPNSGASTRSYTVTGLENFTEYIFQVRALDSNDDPVEHIELPAATPQPQTAPVQGGGGGGDTTTAPADQHGDTPATATAIAADSSTPGEMNSSTDMDYFTIPVPQAGLLVVETTGSVDTSGTLTTSDGTVLAQADSGGTRRNFQITQRVPAGTYLVIVTGRGTGGYRLEVDLIVGFVDNPQPDSAQSGIGVLSGWVCEAETVEVELNGVLQEAAYGTERTDTEPYCEDTNNGFGLLWNWNRLGDGPHTVRVVVDGIEFATPTVTVTTLGLDDEFPTGLTGGTTLMDFPTEGETMRLVWQEAQQNFALAEGEGEGGGTHRDMGTTVLENPQPGSYQSGIRVLSGWVCEAEEVVLEIDGIHRLVAAYGTERTDTEEQCGDIHNGFGVLYNWNKLADGSHTVRLLVDGEEWATATFTVTTLGEEFRRGLTYTAEVEDFPSSGQAVTVEWQEAQQNFVIVGIRD